MTTRNRPIAWTIAGSDSGGGAGIQADLATFQDFGVHGCTVITALTAQNSLGVDHVEVTPRPALAAQIDALHSDLQATAVKLGMLASEDVVEIVAGYLRDYAGFVVCDPVIFATSGDSLLGGDAASLLREKLLPRADLLTPNRDEAAALLGREIGGLEGVERAAADLCALGARSVLITGGHFDPRNDQCCDYWTDGDDGFWLHGPSVDTANTHGTGCTLSAAITACVARGYHLWGAMVLAKAYVTAGLRDARRLGGGAGPVAHTGWPTQLRDYPALSRRLNAEPLPAFPGTDGPLGLYPVVDSAEWIEKLLPLGVETIQLRVKDKSGEALAAEIRRAVELSREYGARLFINDHWAEAIEAGAYGVHLGQGDLDTADLRRIAEAGLRLGVSTHSYYEIARAHALRPSYIAIGPIFPTTSKDMPFGPQGVEQLRRWVDLLSQGYRLTAIGGVDLQRAPEVLVTGVGSCAMITAITLADDYRETVKRLIALHDEYR